MKWSGMRYGGPKNCFGGHNVNNETHKCSEWFDVRIFRDSLISHLGEAEGVKADDRHIKEHPRHIKCSRGFLIRG